MVDLQASLDSLMALLMNGGADVAKEIFKGAVIKGAKTVSDAWRQIFSEKPEAYPLADSVARNPDNSLAQEELRALLEQALTQHPEWVQTISTGDTKADHGSVAAGVIQNSKVTINNH